MKRYVMTYDSKRIKSINNFLSKGNFTIALREIKKYMENYPTDDLGLLVYAECLLRMMNQDLGSSIQHQDIEDICLKVIHNNSKFIDSAWCILGRLREIERDYKEAEDCFRNAVFYGDKGAKDFFAFALIRNRKYQEALDVIDSTSFTDGFSEMTLLKRAMALHGLGRDEEALSIMRNIDTSSFSDRQKRYYSRTKARIYLAMDKIPEAKEIILESIKDRNGYHEEHVILVRCYIKENNLEEAYELCNKLIENFSGEYRNNVICYLGKIYELMGYTEKAKEVYSALYLNETSLSNKIKNILYFSLGHLELCDRNYEQAIQYFEKVKSMDERDISNKKLYLAISYIRLGNLEKAKQLVDSIENSSCLENHTSLYQKVKNVILYSQKSHVPINSYFDQQLVCYRKSLLLKHCARPHKEPYKESRFKEGIDLSSLVDEAEILIQSSPMIESNITDKYLVYYKDVGYLDGISTDYMEVVMIGGTNKILTMYPVKHITEEELKKETKQVLQKKKTFSQIDKFNKRYGLKG